MKIISLIYAVSENHVIGKDNKIPWHIPTDLAYYKRITLGHPIIMGSRTFEGIGRPLPGRQNIVLSDKPGYQAQGVQVAHSIQEAIGTAESDDVFVIGGAKVFESALPLASRIYLTRVHAMVPGDTFFDPDLSHWLEEWREEHHANEHDQYDFTFIVYARP